jgi:hypothetical protein
LVAVDAVIIEAVSCNSASMRCIFDGDKPADLPAQADSIPKTRTRTARREQFRVFLRA